MQEKSYDPLHHKNDRRYQALFKNVEILQDLLIHNVDEPWIDHIDIKSVELLNTKALTGQLARRDADIVYKLPFKNGTTGYLALFLEFQSNPERFMALRVSTYMHLFWENLIKAQQLSDNNKLPPVFGLVLYNGKTNWYCPKTLHGLIELPKKSVLWRYQPQSRYQLIDEKKVEHYHSDSISHQLFEMEHTNDPVRLKELVERVKELISTTPGYQRLSDSIAQWFSAAMFKNMQIEIDFDQTVKDLEGISDMLSGAFERWTKEWKQQGIEVGIETGIDQRSLEVAVDLYKEGAKDDYILRIAKITPEQLQEIKDQFNKPEDD